MFHLVDPRPVLSSVLPGEGFGRAPEKYLQATMAANTELTNAELKKRLSEIGLPRTGNKTTLLKRLEDYKRERQCNKCRVIEDQIRLMEKVVKTLREYSLSDCSCGKWNSSSTASVTEERAEKPATVTSCHEKVTENQFARPISGNGGNCSELVLGNITNDFLKYVFANPGALTGRAFNVPPKACEDDDDVIIVGGTAGVCQTEPVVSKQFPKVLPTMEPSTSQQLTGAKKRKHRNVYIRVRKPAEMVSSDQPIDLSRHGSQRRVMPPLIPLRLVRPNRPVDTPPQPKRPRLDRARSVPQLAPLLPLQRAKSMSESRIPRGSPEPWLFSQLLLQQLSIQRHALEEDKPSTVVRDMEADAKRRPVRPLTGKHVRPGTGASPATLLTLRKKIQARQQQQPCTQRQGWDGNWNDIVVKFPEATSASRLEPLKQPVETGKN